MVKKTQTADKADKSTDEAQASERGIKLSEWYEKIIGYAAERNDKTQASEYWEKLFDEGKTAEEAFSAYWQELFSEDPFAATLPPKTGAEDEDAYTLWRTDVIALLLEKGYTNEGIAELFKEEQLKTCYDGRFEPKDSADNLHEDAEEFRIYVEETLASFKMAGHKEMPKIENIKFAYDEGLTPEEYLANVEPPEADPPAAAVSDHGEAFDNWFKELLFIANKNSENLYNQAHYKARFEIGLTAEQVFKQDYPYHL